MAVRMLTVMALPEAAADKGEAMAAVAVMEGQDVEDPVATIAVDVATAVGETARETRRMPTRRRR